MSLKFNRRSSESSESSNVSFSKVSGKVAEFFEPRMQTYHKRNGQKPSDIFVCSLVHKDLFSRIIIIPVTLGGTIPGCTNRK